MPATTTGTITAADAASVSSTSTVTHQVLVTGSPTAGSSVSAPAADSPALMVTLGGTWSGSLAFEKSVDDGTTWTPFAVRTAGSPTFGTTSASVNGAWEAPPQANAGFRVRALAGFTGTASVAILQTSGRPGGAVSSPVVTRPANTTPYSAGDVVGGVIAFASVGPPGGCVLVQTAALRIDIAALPSGMTSFRLHLYDASPPSALADNAVWDLPAGDRGNYLGYVDLGTPADLGSTQLSQVTAPGVQVELAASSTGLWAYLVTNGAFTPAANSEVYNPRLATVAV